MQTQTTIASQSVASFNTAFAFPPIEVKKVKKAAPEVVYLNRVNLRTLIESQDGKFVSLDFVKLDGVARTLTGRLGVKKFLQGGVNTVESAERPYLTVCDIQLLGYRAVNLSTVSEIRAANKIYRVID